MGQDPVHYFTLLSERTEVKVDEVLPTIISVYRYTTGRHKVFVCTLTQKENPDESRISLHRTLSTQLELDWRVTKDPM